MITGNYQFSPAFGIGGRSRVVSKTLASLGSASNPVPSVKGCASKFSKSQLAEVAAKQAEFRNAGSGSYTGPEQVRSYGSSASDSYSRQEKESTSEYSRAKQIAARKENIAEQEAKIAYLKPYIEKSPSKFDRDLLKEKIRECEYWIAYNKRIIDSL